MNLKVNVRLLFETLMDVQEKEREFNNICGNKTVLFEKTRKNLESIIHEAFDLEYDISCDEIVDLFSNKQIDVVIEFYSNLSTLTKKFDDGEITFEEYHDKKISLENKL